MVWVNNEYYVIITCPEYFECAHTLISDIRFCVQCTLIFRGKLLLILCFAPTTDILPAEVVADIYDNVTIECAASEFPNLKIAWLRNTETFNDTDINHFVIKLII